MKPKNNHTHYSSQGVSQMMKGNEANLSEKEVREKADSYPASASKHNHSPLPKDLCVRGKDARRQTSKKLSGLTTRPVEHPADTSINKKIEDKILKGVFGEQDELGRIVNFHKSHNDGRMLVEEFSKHCKKFVKRAIKLTHQEDLKEIEELRKKILWDVRNYIKLINKALKRYNCKLNIYDLEKKLIKRFKEVKG